MSAKEKVNSPARHGHNMSFRQWSLLHSTFLSNSKQGLKDDDNSRSG